jgi:hypothetical protein
MLPRIFRIMKKDADGKPTIGQTATTMGIRPGEVDLDAQGVVILNDKGMSVNPEWRMAPIFLIPKRLGTGGGDQVVITVFGAEPARFSKPHAGPAWNSSQIVQLTVW